MIYFDYASTTPLSAEVLKTYTYVLENYYANSDSLHDAGLKVNELMEQSRDQIASLLKVKSDDLIFTSGASESNNTFIKGVAFANQHKGKHLITSKVEHSSVNECMKELEEVFGFEVTYLDVNEQGIVEPELLKKALRKDTILVSIMALNNEVGAIFPIQEYAKIVHENSLALFHSDCTQILGKYPIPLKELDGASFSAHKIFGCKGSGLLYRKSHLKLVPLINGGQQEKGARGGTSNAPCNIVLAKTLRLSLESMTKHTAYVTRLNQQLRKELGEMEEIEINSPVSASPYILNFSCKCMTSEILLNALNEHEIYVSAQSTCSSRTRRPSRVLQAMGYDEKKANRSIRVSFSHLNNETEIKLFIQTLKEIMNEYRIKA